MVFPFSCAVGFDGFLLGDVRTGMVGCLPFLSLAVSLVGVGFGLSILGDLGASASNFPTSEATTFTSISFFGTDSSTSVSIAYVAADITLSNSARDVSGKFANAGVTFKASKNSRFMCA